ncbi:MAG: hypothetical protein WAM95_14655 [Bacillus sp. (in: firmicutes)]
MELRDYLNINFPGLILKPSLYDQWSKNIHFELAKGLYQLKGKNDELNPDYFNTVYDQATSLFNNPFSDEDRILLVTNVYQHKDYLKGLFLTNSKKVFILRFFLMWKIRLSIWDECIKRKSNSVR